MIVCVCATGGNFPEKLPPVAHRRCDTASLGVTDSDDTILSTPNIPAGDNGARYCRKLEETTLAWHGGHGYVTGNPRSAAALASSWS